MNTTAHSDSPDKLLRVRDVTQATGICRTAVFSGVKNGTFPVPVRVGSRAVAWRQSEVQAWIVSRPSARQGA